MKKLSANGIKVLKLIHIVFAAIWMAAVVAMVIISALAVTGSGDELYMKYSILMIVDNWLIIVSAMSTLLVGIVYGFFTNWGFFKHRWVVVKWIITVAMILYGTFCFHPWLTENLELANTLRDAAIGNGVIAVNDAYMQYSGYTQLFLLLFVFTISVFKPWKKKKKA